MAAAYYNEFDPKAVAWLRQLIKMGLIADGEVDDRSITEVEAKDLKGFTQHHFFAGIGGWSYALRLAGWSDERPVVTASLPCQPFSAAGLGKGKEDERHLLPHFVDLVRQCDFGTIFGGQVAKAINHGWLDDLHVAMEDQGYAVGAVVLTAAGTGAPHLRERLYWVADSHSMRRKPKPDKQCASLLGEGVSPRGGRSELGDLRAASGSVADNGSTGRQSREQAAKDAGHRRTAEPTGGGMGHPYGAASERNSRSIPGEEEEVGGEDRSLNGGVGNGLTNASTANKLPGTTGRLPHTQDTDRRRSFEPAPTGVGRRTAKVGGSNVWNNPEWIYCRDGKYRPIKRGLEPCVVKVDHGLSGKLVQGRNPRAAILVNATQEARIMRLKGYGNAIVPQVAEQFIRAFMAVRNGTLELNHHHR